MDSTQRLTSSSANEPASHLEQHEERDNQRGGENNDVDGRHSFISNENHYYLGSSALGYPRPPQSARRVRTETQDGAEEGRPPRPISRAPTPIKRTSSLLRRRDISKRRQFDSMITPSPCGGCGQCCRNCERMERSNSFLNINRIGGGGGGNSSSDGVYGFGGVSVGGTTPSMGIGTTADTTASHLADFEVYGVATHQTPPSTPNSGVPTRKNSSSILHSTRYTKKPSSMMTGDKKQSSILLSRSHPGIVVSLPGHDDNKKGDGDDGVDSGKVRADAFGTSPDDDTQQHRGGSDALDITSRRDDFGQAVGDSPGSGSREGGERRVGIFDDDTTSSPDQRQLVEELTIEELDEDDEEQQEENEMCCDAHCSVYEGLEMVICGDKYFSLDFVLYSLCAIFIGITWLLLWTALPEELSEPAGAILGPASTTIVCTFVGQYIVSRNLGLPSIVGVFFVAVIWNHIYEVGYMSQGTTKVVRFVISRVGLTTILIRAGMALSWKSIKPTVFYTTALATIPLAVETVASALLSHTLFSDTYNFDWRWSFLHGLTCSVVAAGVIAPEMLNLALKGYTTGIPPLALSAVGPDTAIGVWAIGFVVQTIFSDHPISLIASLGPVQLIGGVLVGVLIGCVFSLYLRLVRRNTWNNPIVMRRITLACFLSIACAVTFFGEKFVLVGGEAIITLSFATTVGHILQWEALQEDAYLATHIIRRNDAAEKEGGRRQSQPVHLTTDAPSYRVASHVGINIRTYDNDEEMEMVGEAGGIVTHRERSNDSTPHPTTNADRKPTFAISTTANTSGSSSLDIIGLDHQNSGSQTVRNRRRSSSTAATAHHPSATPRLVVPQWGASSTSPHHRFSDTPVLGNLGASSLSNSISDPPLQQQRTYNSNNNSSSVPPSPCTVPSLVPPLFMAGVVFGRSPGSTSVVGRSPLTGRRFNTNNHVSSRKEDPIAGTNMTHLTTQEYLDKSAFDVYRGDSTHRDGMATFKDTFRDGGGEGSTFIREGDGATYRALTPHNNTADNGSDLLVTYREEGTNSGGSPLIFHRSGTAYDSLRSCRRLATTTSGEMNAVEVVNVGNVTPTHDSSRITIALPDRKHRCAAQMRADLVQDLCDFWNFIVAGPLFSMSGTLVDLTQLFSVDFFPKGILILGVGGIVRMVATALCTIGMGWSWKEIAFLPLVWLGKGSVQAATGGVALETAKILLNNLPDSATAEEIADAERMVAAGRIILNTASLYVLVAAPLCAICITRLAPILLTKPSSSSGGGGGR